MISVVVYLWQGSIPFELWITFHLPLILYPMHKPMEVEDGKQIPRNSESSIGSLTMLSSRSFWVEPPTLPLNVRRMYKEVLESSLANSVKLVDEIIGEYFDGGNLYYYARYDQGMARKVCSFSSSKL